MLSAIGLNAQVVYEPITSPVYHFVDEMANEGFIDLSTFAKPYSRQSIAGYLQCISDSVNANGKVKLNKRQQGELDFYLKDFGKELNEGKEWNKRLDLLYHNDDKFTLSVNPILSLETMYNDTGLFYHRRGGAEAFAYFGDHVGMYASLRDNGVNRVVAEDDQITRMQGGNYKFISKGLEGSQ